MHTHADEKSADHRLLTFCATKQLQDFGECRSVTTCGSGTVEDEPPTLTTDRCCAAETFVCTDGRQVSDSSVLCSCSVDACRSCTKQPASEDMYGALLLSIGRHPQLTTAVAPCFQLPLQGACVCVCVCVDACVCACAMACRVDHACAHRQPLRFVACRRLHCWVLDCLPARGGMHRLLGFHHRGREGPVLPLRVIF